MQKKGLHDRQRLQAIMRWLRSRAARRVQIAFWTLSLAFWIALWVWTKVEHVSYPGWILAVEVGVSVVFLWISYRPPVTD